MPVLLTPSVSVKAFRLTLPFPTARVPVPASEPIVSFAFSTSVPPPDDAVSTTALTSGIAFPPETATVPTVMFVPPV